MFLARYARRFLWTRKSERKKTTPVPIISAVKMSNPTTDSVNRLLLNEENKIVSFTRSWCTHCRELQSSGKLDKLANQYEGKLGVYDIDITHAPNIAIQHGAWNCHHFRLYKKNFKISERTSDNIEELISTHVL